MQGFFYAAPLALDFPKLAVQQRTAGLLESLILIDQKVDKFLVYINIHILNAFKWTWMLHKQIKTVIK